MSNIQLRGNAGGNGTTTLQSANTSSTTTFTLPATDGTNGQVVTTDGSGNLTFTTPVTLGKVVAMSMIFGF